MSQKFKMQPGETVRMKGNLLYAEGEAGFKNFLTGKYRVTECTVFLTNQHIVATKARKYTFWGPLVWLVPHFFARTVVFSIPLSELAAIKCDGAKRDRITLQTTSGQEFALVPSFSFFPKRWRAAIASAVTESVSGTIAQETESAITFRNPAPGHAEKLAG